MPPARRTSIVALGSVLLAAAMTTGVTACATPNQDTMWMTSAHQANLAAIAAGQSAQQKATSATARDIGQMMVEDHTTLDKDLTAAAAEQSVALPGSRTQQQQQALNEVEAQHGSAYDSAWVDSQITAHRTALSNTQAEIDTGATEGTVHLAQEAKPVLQHHLTELEAASGTSAAAVSVNSGTGGQAAGTAIPASAWVLILLGAGLILAALVGFTRRAQSIRIIR
jgi:putative membrane protein